MNRSVITLDPDDRLVDAAKILRLSHISQAPVTNQGKLVGMLSRTDLLDHLIRVLEPLPPDSNSDVRKQTPDGNVNKQHAEASV